jgi:2-phosphosulfolactate phosphatase
MRFRSPPNKATRMKSVEVFLTAHSPSEDDLKGKSVLILDVLRASSTIVTALNHGARSIIPVGDMAEAGKMAANMDEELTLLAGERGGKKIEGYHLGNSPLEYTPEVVQGRTIVLNTTNGTPAIRRARGAAEIAIGSFLNASTCIRFLFETPHEAVILCAGTDNRVALEDTICAGFLLHHLWGGKEPKQRSDAARIAFSLYAHDRKRLATAIAQSNHAQHLIRLGFEEDIRYCAQVDTLELLPIYKDSRLQLRDPSAAAVPARAPVKEPEST